MEVKNHWIRILILISYFFLVFIVSRLLDLVLWYQHGYLPTDIVDPILLNVRQLKQLLDSRGVSYTGVLEKQQLVQLLNDSAHVVKSEVDELIVFSNTSERLSTHKTPPSTYFTGGPHFNEKVEDTKDSVWLVQVLPANKRKEPLLDDYSWQLLKHQLAPFGIQTGVFDCAMDRDLCIRRNWLEPILLLALPRGNRPKDHIIIRTSKTPKINMIVKWVKEQLSSRVTKISSLTHLEEQWLNPPASDDTVRVVLLSHLLHTPLFFAALSIKFSGRIKFGIFSVKRDEDPTSSSTSASSGSSYPTSSSSSGVGSATARGKLPLYLVVTPGGTHHYGHAPAQHHTLLHMNLFLRLVLPELNDLFLLALLLTNMLAVIDICQLQGATRWHYLLRTSCLVVTYNLLLFFLSLILYNLSPPPLPLSPLLLLLRALNFSPLGALVRSDLLRLYASPLCFTGSFLLYGFLMGRRFPRPETSSEWTFLGNSFILNSLFRPSERPSRTFTSDVHFELRFEQFILSGAAPRAYNVPNLWLQTSPRVDYMSDLPVFEYRGWRPCPHKEAEVLLRVMDGEVRPECLAPSRGPRVEATTGGSSTPGDRRLCSPGDMESASEGSGAIASSGRNRECSQSSHELNDCTSTERDTVSPHVDNCDLSSAVINNIRSSETGVYKKNVGSNSSSQNPSSDHTSSRGDSAMSRRVVSDNSRSNSTVSSLMSRNNPDCYPVENTSTTRVASSSENSCRISSTEILDCTRSRQSNSMSSREDRVNSVTSREDRTHVSLRENRAISVPTREERVRMSTTEDRANRSPTNEYEPQEEDTEGCDYLECRLIRAKDCAICLEGYAPRAILLALPCAHHFHKSCILAWLQRGHPQCPVCRWPAYKQKYEFSY